MARHRITIQIHGSDEDEGHVRLQDFLQQLESLKTALRHTEAALSASSHGGVYYRIVDLRHDSPAVVVIDAVTPEAAPTPGDRIVRTFFKTVRAIERGKTKQPPLRDPQALESYRALTGPLKKHVHRLTIAYNKERVVIGADFDNKVSRILGPDITEQGSVSGRLEKVNLHNTTRFDIYPLVGPTKVTCMFDPSLKTKVARCLDKYVTVHGELKYKTWDDFPYAIRAVDLDEHPPDDELPRLRDIRGMAPNATGNMSSEEFIESIRNDKS